MKSDWKKYVLTFLITAAIFITAIGVSSWFDTQRLNEVRTLQDSVSINILSSETQFNLLKDAACTDLFTSNLGEELGNLSDHLSYMESIGHRNDPDVITLKRYYSILEIKDYLLINSAATKCPNRPIPILYFYEANCPDCDRQGEVLTYLRQHHPDTLRVYSFDYNLDVSALKTLANINKVADPLPAIVIGTTTYNGFHSIEDIEALIPELNATSTAMNTFTASTTKAKK